MFLLIFDCKEEDLFFYYIVNKFVKKMMKDDYEMEEYKCFVWLNDVGIEKV